LNKPGVVQSQNPHRAPAGAPAVVIPNGAHSDIWISIGIDISQGCYRISEGIKIVQRTRRKTALGYGRFLFFLAQRDELEELEPFRKSRSPVNLVRKVLRLDIVTFGTDYGSVTLEFERNTNGKITHGRQSQTWVRFDEGWRIVAAHVSLLPA